jgi:D-amino peptidase
MPKIKNQFHIRCDLEGVSGVVNLAQVDPSSGEYPEARRAFMAELLALIEGLQEGGAEAVSVYDEHWFGRNVDLSQMPSGVTVHCGKPPYRADWPGGLVAADRGMILHGLHSMAGTGQVLCHTYEPDFRAITLNGRLVGEIGMETAIAGDWGVPLVMIVADSAGAAEAAELVPGVESVVTKVSCSATGAACLPLGQVTAKIRAAALQLAGRPAKMQPLRVPAPVKLRCSFHPGKYLSALRRRARSQFVAADTLELTGATATAVWADYWQLKLAAQADAAKRKSS